MECNVGPIDGKIRMAAGAAILVIGALAQSWWGLIGLIPLATGYLHWCPAYIPLKLKTK